MGIKVQSNIIQERELTGGRWEGLDILKVLCSFMVVVIHAPFPGIIGGYITALSRISVPIFFMITGFFYPNILQKNREKHQIKKMFTLFVVANMVSILAACCKAMTTGSLRGFWGSLLELETVVKFFVWNEPPFGRHLWYLGAILYTLLIVYFAKKANAIRLLTLLTPVLLFLSLVFGKYCIVLFGTQIPYYCVRNFLLFGMPYFLIGKLLFENRKQILNRFTDRLFILGLVIFGIFTVVERYILVTYQVNASNDYYFSTPFLACTVFLKFAKLNCRKNVFWGGVLSRIGKQYSTWIYLIHPLLIGVTDVLIGERLQFLRPCVVFLLALFICILTKRIYWALSLKTHHSSCLRF